VPNLNTDQKRRLAIPARALFVGALCVVCAIGLVAAFGTLFRHTYRPAHTQRAIVELPASRAGAPRTKSEVLLFAHPMCPCTQTTLDELGESLQRLPTNVTARVVFVTAGLPPGSLEQSSTLRRARAMQRVIVEIDQTGELSDRFGATVSGEVFVFDCSGARKFHGGLTAGRGHAGDAYSQQLFERLLAGQQLLPVTAPVFGCRLPKCSGAASSPAKW
jgi:hypothetical protein